MQIGMFALTMAARSFEHRDNAAFATYTSVRLPGAMIDQLQGCALVRSAIGSKREWGQVRARL